MKFSLHTLDYSSGFTGFGLSVSPSVHHSVCLHYNFVSAQYLKNKLIEFYHILYIDMH